MYLWDFRRDINFLRLTECLSGSHVCCRSTSACTRYSFSVLGKEKKKEAKFEAISAHDYGQENVTINFCNIQLQNAALYITEGEKDNVFYHHPEDKPGVLSFYIIHHPVYHFTHLICTILLMLLALIERPSVLAIDEEELLLVCA